jgi:hypothetical protein
MKKIILFAASFFVLILVPISAKAKVHVDIGVALPPPIVAAPPDMIVMPGAPGVYFAPDIRVNLFFWNGWWWRPWKGHWYRSRNYNRGWNYYRRGTPRFYRHVKPGWRGYYKSRRWNDRPWHYRRIPYRRFHRHR